MIPKEWEVKRLSELASKISDGIHKTPVYADDSDIYFINGNNLKNGAIVMHDSTRRVNEEDAVNHRKDLGDRTLLMSINGTIGNLAYYRGENVVLGKSASYININDDTDLDFIFYVLSSSKTQAFYDAELTGTTIRNLSIKSIKNTRIDTPPLAEQKKIAKILSAWDKAITTTEQLLANSQRQKKALMQQLLTGKKRLLDKDGVRFSGEWRAFHLSSSANIVMGSSPKSEAYNEDGIGLPLLQGNADIKNRRSAPRVYTSEITKECEIGDILLSVRAPVGTIALSEHKACIGRGIAALKAKGEFYQDFIYQWLLWFEPRWISLSQGSTFESINSDDIKNLKIVSPDLEEQQKIATVLSAAEQEINTLKKNLDALKQEKRSLMQALLSGKRRVKL